LGVLAGCATPARIDTAAPDSVFQRTGRFAVSVQYDSGRQEAVQGGFAWLDTGRLLTLDLANPLGTTLARVQVGPGSATLTRSNGEQESAPSADALVEKVLGSPIPVAGLRYWLRGQTGQASASDVFRSPQGQPQRFVQDGWRVELLRYDGSGPQLLRLNRNEANRSISVRLVVDAG
jgi:outer membrane lipoprotein LolB